MLQTNPEIDHDAFAQVLGTIHHIMIAQASAPDTVYNAVLFEGTDRFSPDSISSLGMLYTDTGYVSKQVAPNIWIYGDELSLAYFAQTTDATSLAVSPQVKTVLKEFANQKASVLFYSTPTDDTTSTSPLAASFAQKLQYTALFATPSLEKSQGKVIMQFSWTTLTKPEGSFIAKHASDISPETLLYLEARKILDTFGLSADQFSLWLSLLLGQVVPGTSSLLSTQELSDLYQALNERLTIFLESAATPFGMGIDLVIDDPASFDILTTLAPVRKILLTGFLGTTGSLLEQRTDDSRTLSMALPSLFDTANGAADLWADLSFPILSVTHDDKTTTLSLLGPKSAPGETVPQLSSTDESLLTFRYDPSVVTDAAANPLLGELSSQFAQLGTGIIIGQLSVDSQAQQLIATFESK